MGIFNQNFWTNPRLAGSLGIMAAGGPSRMPVSMGQGLLAGLKTGSDVYRQNQAHEIKQLEQERQNQLLKIRRRELDQAIAAARAKQRALASLPAEVRRLAEVNPSVVNEYYKEQNKDPFGFQGSGMGAQSYNALLQARMREFDQKFPQATPQEREAYGHAQMRALAQHRVMSPRMGPPDAFGNPTTIQPTQLPDVTAGYPQRTVTPPGGKPQGMLPTPRMANDALNTPVEQNVAQLPAQVTAETPAEAEEQASTAPNQDAASPGPAKAPEKRYPRAGGMPIAQAEANKMGLDPNTYWVWRRTGGEWVPKSAGSRGKPTEFANKSAGFYKRMVAAEKGIAELTAKGFNPGGGGLTGFLQEWVLQGNVGSRWFEGGLPEDAQRYVNFAKEWVRAKLRQESGAQIPVDEMADEIMTYFAAPGQNPAVVKDKARFRQTATSAMYDMALPAIDAIERRKAGKNTMTIEELERRAAGG